MSGSGESYDLRITDMHIGFVSDYHLVTKEYLFHLIKYSDSRTSSSTELHTAGAFYLKQLQVIAHFFFCNIVVHLKSMALSSLFRLYGWNSPQLQPLMFLQKVNS